jgi:hypothetical protein
VPPPGARSFHPVQGCESTSYCFLRRTLIS